jgi:hypothetical protein
MLDILVFIIVVIAITGSVLENIRLKNKNTELLFLLAQLSLDNDAIKKRLSSPEDIEKDHLIKFLSETRESSYIFIEEFQQELKNFKEDLESHVEHFDKFGILSKYNDVHFDMSKKFVEHYKKLIKFLPENNDHGR